MSLLVLLLIKLLDLPNSCSRSSRVLGMRFRGKAHSLYISDREGEEREEKRERKGGREEERKGGRDREREEERRRREREEEREKGRKRGGEKGREGEKEGGRERGRGRRRRRERKGRRRRSERRRRRRGEGREGKGHFHARRKTAKSLPLRSVAPHCQDLLRPTRKWVPTLAAFGHGSLFRRGGILPLAPNRFTPTSIWARPPAPALSCALCLFVRAQLIRRAEQFAAAQLFSSAAVEVVGFRCEDDMSGGGPLLKGTGLGWVAGPEREDFSALDGT
ncbi:Octapeptide-repeat protein T2, partial [Ophiophagus hannah]